MKKFLALAIAATATALVWRKKVLADQADLRNQNDFFDPKNAQA
jgi:hypothetical protein